MKRYMRKMSDLRVLTAKTKMLGVASTTGVVTALVASSVVQATDLQIYTVPTAGQKTIVMMLDTSASMGPIYGEGSSFEDYGLEKQTLCGVSNNTNSINGIPLAGTTLNNLEEYYTNSTASSDGITYKRVFCYIDENTATSYADVKKPASEGGCEPYSYRATIGGKTNTYNGYKCYDRLTRLKDGMFAFLDSNDPVLNRVKVGLGHYGEPSKTVRDGQMTYTTAAKILVKADALGAINSAHRTLLKNKISSLSASGGTPTANALAEGAAYLMGTNTLSRKVITVDYYKKLNNRYYLCKRWDAINSNNEKQCSGRSGTNTTNWTDKGTPVPTDLSNYTLSNGYYVKQEYEFNSELPYSGYDVSVEDSKNEDEFKYISPLPDVLDRQSCDGQGVYLLSDGIPSGVQNAKVMANALGRTSFSDTGGLSGKDIGSAEWTSISKFARDLFNGGIIQPIASNATNPVNVPIQTAFVGFGKVLNDPKKGNALSACQVSSRTQVDRSSNDLCSPVLDANNNLINTTLGVRSPGFGNGGFFVSKTSQNITNSVIQFINNLGVAPLDPLSTGAISVPVDALNPSGYQPFGYLRALEPNPAMPVKVWIGNLKKYSIENGALKADAVTVFDQSGIFNQNTQDMWNTTTSFDGGLVRQGGVYSQLPMPTNSSPNTLRNLLTDVALDNANVPVKMTDYSQPLLVVPKPTGSQSTLDAFASQSILEEFDRPLKLKLLNYLGYDLDLTTNEILPTSLTAPNNPFVSMGGSIHSFPVQLTYSGDLDSAGNLTDVRKQSVLYGSMEGALRIVDAETGEEQMAFVPADILLDTEASRALRAGEAGNISHGVSGAWVADPTYRTVRSSKKDEPSTIEAKTMNVYGGLRMGGESYYGLDALDPKVPKVLFRIGSDQAGYERMGQTWSKPVLINVRHNGKIKRAMVVGGGYDMCYENPRFKLNTANPAEFQIKNAAGVVTDTCKKEEAKGNAIYVVDALTGEKLWWASNGTADTTTAFYNQNLNLKHSVVSRISTIDRDGDGLIDHLYFGDLGGQVFRADLDNQQKLLGTVEGKDDYSPFGVRVTLMANLGQSLKSDDSGDHVGSADLGDSPRFYQAPTVTIHDQGKNTFIAVTIASGDRSTPLDVTPLKGRETMLPSEALTDRPKNNVYSIFDHDFVKKTLIKGTVNLVSKNLVLDNLQKDPQLLADGTYIPTYFTDSGIGKYGWYRSLSSQPDGTELVGRAVGDVTRVAGGVKAFEEEPIAISNNFFVPVYDPQGNSIAAGDPCKPRIVGESNRQQYCLPYGVCLTTAGYKNNAKEDKTGFQLDGGKNANVLGAGIRGITLGPSDSSQTGGGKNSCGSLTLLGNIEGAGQWDCQRVFNPTRWYEKYVTAK